MIELVRDEGRLPLDIAFLADGIVPNRVLRQVSVQARMQGVSAALVLLAEGHITGLVYYRALASHLGLTFAEHPVRPASTAVLDDVLRTGILPLTANAQGWRYLMAPRNAVLQALIAHRTEIPTMPPAAITSPDRLEALVRHAQRRSVARDASHGLADWNQHLSARDGLSAAQWIAGTVVFGAGVAATLTVPGILADGVMAVFAVTFLASVLLRLAATAASPPLRSGMKAPARQTEIDLPVYSVVVPLYREAREVERLVASLGRLDYPRAKLDILVVVEANDVSTLKALDRMALPACFRVIVAPAGHPRTKPRALNVALQFARGTHLVVYDAEDDPDPDQLRAAAAHFADEAEIACLQAKLAIDNIDDSWLTRLFALEYAALFHVINPGLAELRLPIPLGGTSNHFRVDVLRRLNGWDAWNVTEDIDLGLRLARFGHRVATLDSVTYEEAPHTLKAWLAQRSRWQKGWMVTLATHSRHPLQTWRDLGFCGGVAAVAMLCGTIGSSLLGPFGMMMLALRLRSGDLLNPHTTVEAAWSSLSCFLITTGVASAVWPAITGARRRRLARLCLWLPALPVYLLLMSVAAWQAAIEVFGRPYAWRKTEHGRAKRRTLGAQT